MDNATGLAQAGQDHSIARVIRKASSSQKRGELPTPAADVGASCMHFMVSQASRVSTGRPLHGPRSTTFDGDLHGKIPLTTPS